MRYLIALVLGIVTGAAAVAAVLLFNPAGANLLSPLALSQNRQLSLNFSAVANDSILYTNNGDSLVAPWPEKISELWEGPIRQSEVLVTELYDGRGDPVGIGVKFSSRSERTRLLQGEAFVNSVWHVILPGQGTMLVEQTENYWNFLREIVVPAYLASGKSWKGRWHGTMSAGPGSLGTAKVHGGSGRFMGLEAEAIETYSAQAYSTKSGPVILDGQLVVELPGAEVSAIMSPDVDAEY